MGEGKRFRYAQKYNRKLVELYQDDISSFLKKEER